MHHFVAMLHTLGVTTTDRVTEGVTRLRERYELGRSDRGSVTLEQVLIGLGLFLAAGLVVAGLTAAINSRLNQIK